MAAELATLESSSSPSSQTPVFFAVERMSPSASPPKDDGEPPRSGVSKRSCALTADAADVTGAVVETEGVVEAIFPPESVFPNRFDVGVIARLTGVAMLPPGVKPKQNEKKHRISE